MLSKTQNRILELSGEKLDERVAPPAAPAPGGNENINQQQLAATAQQAAVNQQKAKINVPQIINGLKFVSRALAEVNPETLNRNSVQIINGLIVELMKKLPEKQIKTLINKIRPYAGDIEKAGVKAAGVMSKRFGNVTGQVQKQ